MSRGVKHTIVHRSHMVQRGPNWFGRHRAFTTTDLVVAICAILVVGHGVVAAGHALRERHRERVCADNLRQLSAALKSYSELHAGALPTWSGWHVAPNGTSAQDEPGLGWTEQLMKGGVMSLDVGAHYCPAFPPAARFTYFLSSRWLKVQQPERASLSWAEIHLPDRFVLSGDCTAPGLYFPPFGSAGLTTNDCDKDDASGKALLFAGEDGGVNMHPHGNNVLFADGHVAAFTEYDPTRMTYHPSRMQDWADVTAE
jgi:prepilin-type processing-associated H-X9-DG protein